MTHRITNQVFLQLKRKRSKRETEFEQQQQLQRQALWNRCILSTIRLVFLRRLRWARKDPVQNSIQRFFLGCIRKANIHRHNDVSFRVIYGNDSVRSPKLVSKTCLQDWRKDLVTRQIVRWVDYLNECLHNNGTCSAQSVYLRHWRVAIAKRRGAIGPDRRLRKQ